MRGQAERDTGTCPGPSPTAKGRPLGDHGSGAGRANTAPPWGPPRGSPSPLSRCCPGQGETHLLPLDARACTGCLTRSPLRPCKLSPSGTQGAEGWGLVGGGGCSPGGARAGRWAGGHTDGRGEGAGGRLAPREGQVSPPPDQGQPTPAAAPALPETTVHPRRWASGHSPVQQPPQRQLPLATPAPAAANKSFCTPTCGWTPGPCAGRAGRLGPHPSRDPACHRPGSPLASPQGLGV